MNLLALKLPREAGSWVLDPTANKKVVEQVQYFISIYHYYYKNLESNTNEPIPKPG
jgi:hypothetical protein